MKAHSGHQKFLISIVGPTAVGKTSLSIHLAQHFFCPIISCDSRQFYREMKIGTAVPTSEELAKAEHYFIHDRSITAEYSIGAFERDAINLLDRLYENHNVVIMVGGSGMYEKAVNTGLNDFPAVSTEITETLEKELQATGLENLKQELKSVDPIYYASVDIENPRRVLRALGMYRGNGQKMSDLQDQKLETRRFTSIKIGLTADREELYQRINKRVDTMLADGLIDEAKQLKRFQYLRPLQTVGYQEVFPYLDGEYNLEEAIRLIKRNTRRYAKRQITWYRKNDTVNWFNYKTRHTDIAQRVDNLLMDGLKKSGD